MQGEQALLPEFEKGIAEFNRCQFFECHETLEALWQHQGEPERQFTQGIIQIAVGFYHLLRNNRTGAQRLFERGLGRIRRFPPDHLGLNMHEFAHAVADNLSILKTTPVDEQIDFAVPEIIIGGKG